MLDKQSKNLGTGGTIPRKMVVNIKYGACMQQHLFEYFSEEENRSFLENVSITSIDKADPLQKYSEDCWRSTLKTLAPWGLNVEDYAFCFILTTGFKRIVIRT